MPKDVTLRTACLFCLSTGRRIFEILTHFLNHSVPDLTLLCAGAGMLTLLICTERFGLFARSGLFAVQSWQCGIDANIF